MRHEVPPVPNSLLEDLVFSLGESGARLWLAQAVAAAEDLMVQWRLEPHEVLTGGSMSLCIKCEGTDGADLVLKIPANVPGGATETAALRAWGGNGAARLLREDTATSAMLMNFLGRVGEGSYGVADIVDLAARLHAADPSGHPFGPIEENLARRVGWARDRFAVTGDVKHLDDLATTEKMMPDLVSVQEPQVLLHGDLQAKNLIVHVDELTAVDPMPTLGPAVFDLAFWIAKSVHSHPTMSYIDQVAGLRPDLDRPLLLRWTWALAVLENRPYLARGREQRQEFIDGLRTEVLTSA
ncbi:MAG: phosphotransferase [Nocardioidaceae bacterium]|nr:phosphotransferase [Nocardioidaceae bacterium]